MNPLRRPSGAGWIAALKGRGLPARTAVLLIGLALALALVVAAGQFVPSAHAQESTPSRAAERERELERIRQERAALDERFTGQEVACYQRFVVTSCIDDARKARRNALAELQRQEGLLEQEERRERASSRLQQLDQRQIDRRAQDAQKAAEREQREAQQALDAASPGGQTPQNAQGRAQKTQAQRDLERQKEQADRQQQAEQRKRTIDSRQLERSQTAPDQRAADEARARAQQAQKLENAAKRREELNRRAADPARKGASALPVPP